MDSILGGRERSSTLGSLRDRGLTFGSEFDLGLGLNLGGVQDSATGSSSDPLDFSVLTPRPNIVSADNSSASPKQNASNGQGGGPEVIPHDKEEGKIVPGLSGAGMPSVQYINVSNHNHHNNNNKANGTSNGGGGETDVASSNSKKEENGFLSGLFGVNDVLNHSNHTSKLFGHTPPSAVPTSYEGRHFGKRMRSSSISGRLRSMSDLEDRGIIDNRQKGILKDLIISGDDALQAALDNYEQGDTSALEALVKSGALRNKNTSDIDLLGDLDLDFLSMQEDFGTDADSNPNASKPIPIPPHRPESANSGPIHYASKLNSGASTPRDRPHSPSFDGIGDLEFNGDYGSSNHESSSNPIQVQNILQVQPPAFADLKRKTRSDSVGLQRFRANSLAFDGLFDDANSVEQQPVGNWMDRTVVQDEKHKPLKKRGQVPNIVGANGALYIIHDPTQKANTVSADEDMQPREDSPQRTTRTPDNKKDLRMRESQLKKERKESKASKQDEKRKSKKGDSTPKRKNVNDIEESDEERKEVVSGTGRPRSLSDPNLSIGLDSNGLMHVDGPPDWVGAYSPESRKIRIERFLAKRNHRVWVKKVKYDVRKNFADSRLRVKGRFVKKEDELLMRDLMSLT